MHSTYTNILTEYGFSETAARIYLVLLEIGRGSAESIHRITNIDRIAITQTLIDMYTQEYIFCVPKDGVDEYSVITPQELINRKQESCQKLKQYMLSEHDYDKIEHIYTTNTTFLPQTVNTDYKIKYYEGFTGLTQYYQEHITSGKTMYSFVAPDSIHPILLEHLDTHHLSQRLQHNVSVKAILDNCPGKQKQRYIDTSSVSLRETLCIEDTSFTIGAGINIIDNCRVGIVLYTYHEMSAIIIDSKKFASTIQSLFAVIRDIYSPALK